MEFDPDERVYTKRVHDAATEFALGLIGKPIVEQIALCAEMAGLILLRCGAGQLPAAPPGTVVIGILPDSSYERIDRFMRDSAIAMGLIPEELVKAQIPDATPLYFPEISQLERKFCKICESHGVKPEHFAISAAQAALVFIRGGGKRRLLE